MSIDPRIALQSLVSAFEEHLAAAAGRRGEKDPVVESAYLAIADAFEVYEEVLYDAYGEVTPLEIYDDEDDDDDELIEDTDDDDVPDFGVTGEADFDTEDLDTALDSEDAVGDPRADRR